MKNIISNAIDKIDWLHEGVIDHIKNNKRKHEEYYRDKIFDFLCTNSNTIYYKEKEINLIRGQRVDLIEIGFETFLRDFIYDNIKNQQLPVSRIVEFGHNNSCQSKDYHINKSLSDIKKRTYGQKLNNLYTVQVIPDIKKIRQEECYLSKTYGTLTGNSHLIKEIDKDFNRLDPYFVKKTVPVLTASEQIDIHFYICGPFSDCHWNLIVNNFLDYLTTKGKRLKIIYENDILK